jgi:AraC family transcriptional regulator
VKATTLEDYKKRILHVLIYIQENLDNELSLRELAEVAHFSPFHFHRIFRGMVGESLHAHVRRIRLERAVMRLRYTSQPIIDIAFEAGYETHEAFTRAFRSLTGHSPSEFRKNTYKVSAPSGVHYSLDKLDDFTPLEEGGSKMGVTIKKLEPMRVAFMRHIGPYDECGKTWEVFLAHMGSKGYLGPGTMMLGLCHDDPEVTPPDKLRYDACLTVDEDYQPEGGIGVQTISGGEYAVTTHHGPYATVGETYGNLYGQWMPHHGLLPRSLPCFEVYLNDPESTEPEELLTDIYAPIEPK